ncbi:MAG: histone deacetylase [Marinoscillum sp.]
MLKIAWSRIYRHPLPENHRFPMIKYDLIPEQLIYEGTITSSNLFEPHPLEADWILTTHSADYWHKLQSLDLSKQEERRIGFPLSNTLVNREIVIANGTIKAAKFALEYGVSMNVAGGTHHAFRDRGEGFCLLNDIAIAANYLLETRMASNILIVDLDVHQGNGTASIFQDNESIFTFSMHGRNNYPLKKEKSDLDIELEDGVGDQIYLDLLEKNLNLIGESFKPDFIFFQSGVDVLESDKLGRLRLSMGGCKSRDAQVISYCKANQIPLVITMGGGYSPKWRDLLEAHANTFRTVQDTFF